MVAFLKKSFEALLDHLGWVMLGETHFERSDGAVRKNT